MLEKVIFLNEDTAISAMSGDEVDNLLLLMGSRQERNPAKKKLTPEEEGALSALVDQQIASHTHKIIKD